MRVCTSPLKKRSVALLLSLLYGALLQAAVLLLWTVPSPDMYNVYHRDDHSSFSRYWIRCPNSMDRCETGNWFRTDIRRTKADACSKSHPNSIINCESSPICEHTTAWTCEAAWYRSSSLRSCHFILLDSVPHSLFFFSAVVRDGR